MILTYGFKLNFLSKTDKCVAAAAESKPRNGPEGEFSARKSATKAVFRAFLQFAPARERRTSAFGSAF